jgi:predicted metal-dependent hydrolase
LIFINVRKIPDEKNLEDTMVHELLHLRFPYLAHGKRFNKLVRQGLRGKTFLPYRKRAKTSAI